MKTIERTRIINGSHGWNGETLTADKSGGQWKITTIKQSSGKINSYAMPVQSSDNGRVLSFSMSDFTEKKVQLLSNSGRATEKAIRDQHSKAILIFDQKDEAGEIPVLKHQIKTDWIGQVIFTDGLSEENKRVIYEVETTVYGENFKTVLLDGSDLRIDNRPRPIQEKFGIGVYYKEGERLSQSEIDNLLITAHAEVKARYERERAEQEAEKAERLQKIEEGKKLVTIPEGVKSVIVADLYQDDSDIMTDYFSTSVSKRVYLAWSRSDRNNIKELHKAKLNFEDTAELEEEHTRGHSYLPDYFVGSSSWSGWKVHKDKLFFKYRKDANIEDLYIAAAEGRFLISEEVKPEPVNVEGVQFIDYSEKAFAIIGDTREIKDQLKELGGRWNNRLSCGAGWIFSKARSEEAVKEFLKL